ncbi:P-loop containing nucleoside triphosphate hydrolase protein [Schizophyllum amplum]|uniref:P-loop containing nucleoside triphosphate hydrolase protein n=1 Tax=Schizophyllum amplum TaxID=97359 RepID=A0A550C6V1_9AGAR|nr:P-loop containing nucleoside triphosphate hydrolase protein [Auriculariopsis ampla]
MPFGPARYPGSCVNFPQGRCTAGDLCRFRHDLTKCSCGLILPFGNLRPHERGRKHQILLQQQQQRQHSAQPAATSAAPAPRPRPAVRAACETCGAEVAAAQMQRHRHQHIQDDIAAARAALYEDKNNVVITPGEGVDFGVVDEFEEASQSPTWWMGSSARKDAHGEHFSSAVPGMGVFVKTGQPRTIILTLHPAYVGNFEDTLFVRFVDTMLGGRPFVIARKVHAVIGSRADHEQLRPSAPYVRRQMPAGFFEGAVVPSTRPTVWTRTEWKRGLGGFDAPKELIAAVYGKRGERRQSGAGDPSMIQTQFLPRFGWGEYGEYFQERQRQDLESYALQGAELKANYPNYEVAEGRPSVLGELTAPWYQGRVHAVMLDAVKLRFPDEFSTYRGAHFDVRFVLNRLSYRRMHDALANKNKPMRILFPAAQHVKAREPVTAAQMDAVQPVNRAIADDEEQLRTIAAILRLPPGSPPLIVFGPPGTGKTSRTSRPALKRFSMINDNTVFAVPPTERLASYRVVVSSAGLGIRGGHYDWVFIDECAQATEPAAMIPLKTLVNKDTNVVLAGDPQQLGPIVHSNYASVLGLKESYMGRLMEQQDVYDLNRWQGVTIMKLIKSFRSHPALLDYSNRRFYNGELVPSADPILTHSMEGSEILPKRNFPILFHAVIGRDARERSSPSFFNAEEASLVKKYCGSLLSDRRHQLRPQDIGVITPYHAQTQKIASLVDRDERLRGITVGSIEQFQGQERRVIIISTVRSNEDFLVSDIRRMLGFVANPRRFNVAITRAQAMLIVVGNPRICGWRGVPISWDPNEELEPGPEGYDGRMNRLAAEQARDLLQQLRATVTQEEEGGADLDLSDDESDE